jgi:threonine/homoserine efflux transporter RhtA
MSGIGQLGLSMLVAAIVATPFGIIPAAPSFRHPVWLAWGIGVGLCSSVIPYVTDQLAMARLPRATFALMLALLPAAATVIGLVVLAQVPTPRDLAGIAWSSPASRFIRMPTLRGKPTIRRVEDGPLDFKQLERAGVHTLGLELLPFLHHSRRA